MKHDGSVFRLIDQLLAIVQDGLRFRLAQLNLCAHFLKTRGEDGNLFLQFLHFSVLFEKLVEQHRVHFVIADDASTQNALPTMMINAFLVFI